MATGDFYGPAAYLHTKRLLEALIALANGELNCFNVRANLLPNNNVFELIVNADKKIYISNFIGTYYNNSFKFDYHELKTVERCLTEKNFIHIWQNLYATDPIFDQIGQKSKICFKIINLPSAEKEEIIKWFLEEWNRKRGEKGLKPLNLPKESSQSSGSLQSLSPSDTLQYSDNKFDNPDSQSTEASATHQQASSPSSDSPPNNILDSGVVKFVGRDEALKNLHNVLQKDKRVVIKGMGGVGKTELAIQYCQQHFSTYTGGICWISARGENEKDVQGKVASKIIQFAISELGFEPPTGENITPLTQVRFCWRNWSYANNPVLIVLDDVNNYVAIRDYLPKYPRFKVLITTRLQLDTSLTTIMLDVLERPKAFSLLSSLVDRERNHERLRKERWIARKLVKWLGCLPLGIELVGRYLERQQDLSLSEMLQRLEYERLKSPAVQDPNTEEDMTAQLGVEAAFNLSWKELNETAQRLACLLSLFALEAIPWSLVELAASDQEQRDLEIAQNQLIYLSLLKHTGKETYQLHQIIREFFKGKLVDLVEAEQLKRSFCKAMVVEAQKIPNKPTQTDMIKATLAIHHLAEVATAQKNWLSDEDFIIPFVVLARYYKEKGAYAQALKWSEECYLETKTRLGLEHPYVAASINLMARVLFSQGSYEEAKALYIKALELMQDLLGDEHPDVATAINNLAGVYLPQGRYEEAEILYIQALKLGIKILENEHILVANIINTLAVLYRFQCRYKDAEKLCIQALELGIKSLKNKHLLVANIINTLAVLYRFQCRYKDAEKLCIQALELRKIFLGNTHDLVVDVINNLAGIYFDQRRYEESKYLYFKALGIKINLFGDEHRDVATIINNLARLYFAQGRYEEAKIFCIQALELRKKLLGNEHPFVADSINDLATIYWSQGKYDDAEKLYFKSLNMKANLFENEYIGVATTINNLARLYRLQGRYEEAENFCIQALELRKKLLGNEHPFVADSMNTLATIYRLQGRYEEAENFCIQALELKKKWDRVRLERKRLQDSRP